MKTIVFAILIALNCSGCHKEEPVIINGPPVDLLPKSLSRSVNTNQVVISPGFKPQEVEEIIQEVARLPEIDLTILRIEIDEQGIQVLCPGYVIRMIQKPNGWKIDSVGKLKVDRFEPERDDQSGSSEGGRGRSK